MNILIDCGVEVTSHNNGRFDVGKCLFSTTCTFIWFKTRACLPHIWLTSSISFPLVCRSIDQLTVGSLKYIYMQTSALKHTLLVSTIHTILEMKFVFFFFRFKYMHKIATATTTTTITAQTAAPFCIEHSFIKWTLYCFKSVHSWPVQETNVDST